MPERKASVAIIGRGGREAVMAEAYAKSPHVEKVFVLPGNDLIQDFGEGKITTVSDIESTDVNSIENFALVNRLTLVNLGDDASVAAGNGDRLRAQGILVVGPSQEAGRMESDKVFARKLARDAGVAQPAFWEFKEIAMAKGFLEIRREWPVFIKAAGLAEGKGVKQARHMREAKRNLIKLASEFPNAMGEFLIEDAIYGEEVSAFYAVSGTEVTYLGSAKDHKRAFDNDEGENTGGMGALSNPQIMEDRILREGVEESVKRQAEELVNRGTPYQGIWFEGVMQTKEHPEGVKLETNARWGDPEAQVIIPGILNDFFELNMAVAEGKLKDIKLQMDGLYRVSVTLATKGYPEDYSSGLSKRIYGLEDIGNTAGVSFYPAGINKIDGEYKTAGGRLGHFVGTAKTLRQARDAAYDAIDLIEIEGNNRHFRSDIGKLEIEKRKQSRGL